jgi:hypothetical protein
LIINSDVGELSHSKFVIPAKAGIQKCYFYLDVRLRGCVKIDKTAHIAVFVIPGLTRARSEALALSSVFSNYYATGCRIKSGMTSRN